MTLDTNLLVYAAQRDERRHPAAIDIVHRAAGADCVQTLQSLGECFNVLRRKSTLSVPDARAAIRDYRVIFKDIVSAAPEDLDKALSANDRHGLQFWDAMLWATAKRAGCKLILSEDFQDGRTLEGVLFVNPFKPENARVLDLALPPIDGAAS